MTSERMQFPRTRREHRRRSLGVVAVVVVALLTASCAHRTDRDELLAANGGAPSTGAAGFTDGSTAGGDAIASEPGAQEAAASAGGEGTSTAAGPARSTGGAGPSTTGNQSGTRASGGQAPSATCKTPGETGRIAIGSVGNYSGAAGSSLIAVPRTLQLWAQWVNHRGGICGRQVQIVVVDDHSDPAQYRAALQDLVENRKVVSFTNGATLTADAGIEYLKSVRVPEVGGLSGNEALWDSPVVFKTSARAADMIFGTARNIALHGPGSPDVALVTCREVQGCGQTIRKELIDNKGAERAGVRIVYSTEASIAQPDYTAECRGAQASGAKTVILMLDAASVRRFGQSCARQGYNPFYGQIASTVEADSPDQPGLANLLVALPSFPFIAAVTPAQQEFQRAMAELGNGKPGPGEATAWAGAKMFELAATRAAIAKGSITSATIIEALQQLQNETLGGLIVPVTYRRDQAGLYSSCWFGAKSSGGGPWTVLSEAKPLCRE